MRGIAAGNMELYQLRTFVAAAESGSLTQAASRQHLSQPAASGQIKALEDELGIKLFSRSPRGLSLTRAGAELLPRAQVLLRLAGEVRATAARLAGHLQGRIAIGAVFDPELLRLGEVMSTMLERHPMVEIDLHHASSLGVLEGLRRGSLDAGFLLGRRLGGRLQSVALKALRYRIVGPVAWRAQLDSADWPDLEKLPWISTPRDGSHHQMCSDIFARHAIAPATTIGADHESIIATLVASGVGLGLMREDLAAQAHAESRVVIVPIGGAQTLLQLVFDAERAAEPVIAALVAVVSELWQASEPTAAVQDPSP